MNSDFCAFILTHGRPDRVLTYDTIRKAGYTGKIYIVIDDEDKTGDEYRKKFGDIVLTFSKEEIAKRFDEGDNFNDRRAIFYARNACFDLAKKVCVKYFVQLDDDYTNFELRYNSKHRYGYAKISKSLDAVFDSILAYFASCTRMSSIALSQGGDWIGGNGNNLCLRRKAMNSFFCSVDRPYQFVGRINEDVNTYTSKGRAGDLFFTVMQSKLVQLQTQTNSGGMTETYLDNGTYIKSFYSVIYCPSSVKISELRDPRGNNARIHHRIDWNSTAPLILRQEIARRKHEREFRWDVQQR